MPHDFEPFFLAAMDPGATTGLALFDIQKNSYSLVTYQAVPYEPTMMSSPVMVLKEWKEIHGRQPHALVYENFHIRPDAVDPDTKALNVIGGVEHWLMEHTPYIDVTAYEPVQGKHFVTDEILANAGLLVSRKHEDRHVRDATRHAVTYLQKKIRHLALCRAAWPRSPRLGS
jgi:hypothetical protein